MRAIDHLMMVLAVIHPLTGVPQVVHIYTTQQVEGISLATWLGFMAIGLVYLYYAILHSLKPLILTQILWFIVDIAIIVGILLFR